MVLGSKTLVLPGLGQEHFLRTVRREIAMVDEVLSSTHVSFIKSRELLGDGGTLRDAHLSQEESSSRVENGAGMIEWGGCTLSRREEKSRRSRAGPSQEKGPLWSVEPLLGGTKPSF